MRTCPVCKRSWEQDFRICPIDGIPLEDAPAGGPSVIGMTIGRCRLVEKIADGDVGPIYKAEDPIRGVTAVQIIPAERLSSPILKEAFGDTVKHVSQLNHPNAVRVYGMESMPDGGVAVLMEYVAGGNLQNYRRQHPGITTSEACRLIRQACEAVIAAHRLSLLHGALHPTRILIALDGTVKVGGFHRGGIREGTDVFSATAATLPYLAPEQLGILREVVAPDYRADVYALGVILYELLAGRLPYEPKTAQELAVLLEGSPPLPPNFTNPQVSPLLARVVQRAIAKHPTERQESVQEFMREMDAASQPAREPQRPVVESGYEPHYPAADSGLSAPSPGPSARKESTRGIWPESAPAAKEGSGTGSFGNWFQTSAEGSRGADRQADSRPYRSPLDDSSYGDSSPRRKIGDESEEHTVVVTSPRRERGRRRSLSDTFTGFWSREADLTGTGTGALPRRRLTGKIYIGLAIGAVLILGAVIVYFLLFGSASTGKLVIESVPPGAQVYVNEEFRGGTPLPVTELKAGIYRIRLKLDGYESKEDMVEVPENSNIEKSYVLVKQAQIPSPPPAFTPPPAMPITPPPVQPVTTAKPSPLAGAFSNALRARNLFPPNPDNAWDILQRWQQGEAGSPSQALEQARVAYCREAEALGMEKIEQKDFAAVRSVLDRIRNYNPGIPCATGLFPAYESAVSRSKSDLITSARAAMERQNFVTPETENALRYVRLTLAIDPQDPEARTLENDIFMRAWDQAQAKSSQRQHQDAIDIYNQLKRNYPNPAVGVAVIDQNIEKQTQKLNLLKSLKVPYSVQVRHDHGRRWIILGKGECTGVLRVDGFAVEYQSPGGHPFKVTYEGLKEARVDRDRITIQGVGVPDGRIELEQVERNPSPNVTQIAAKIQELRKLNADYLKP